MDKLGKRLAALEGQRPIGRQVEDMTDGELTRVITGHTSTIITDEQLTRIVEGEPWINLRSV